MFWGLRASEPRVRGVQRPLVARFLPTKLRLSWTLAWRFRRLDLEVWPYGQSPYQDSGFQRVGLKHNFNVQGWNSQAHGDFPGKFDLSQQILVGIILVGIILVARLGVVVWPPLGACRATAAQPLPGPVVRPISLLTLPLLTLLDSNFPGNSPWAWEFHPLKIALCLSQTL